MRGLVRSFLEACIPMDRFRRVVWGRIWLLLRGPFVFLFALLLASLALAAGNFETWKFDLIHLKKGDVIEGLITEQTAIEVKFWRLKRKPGERTFRFKDSRPLSEVSRIVRLEGKDRELLRERVEALDPRREEHLMKEINLQKTPWLNQGQTAFTYATKHFTLVSTSSEPIVKRAAVRLSQVYAACERLLPPRRKEVAPTRILLVQSDKEYPDLLRKRGLVFVNPAYYDAATHQIVCASPLQELNDAYTKVSQANNEKRRRLDEQEDRWRKEFHGRIPKDKQESLQKDRDTIKQADLENRKRLEQETDRLYRNLYHEAFHAYLAEFVYPPDQFEVPRWLNEGLAQVFETGFWEAGELRMDCIDSSRLARIKAAEKGGDLVPVINLLRAAPQDFQVAHAQRLQEADRYYLTSWAMAYYLAIERNKLAESDLELYVASLKRGQDPLDAFQVFAGQKLTDFERDFRQFIRDWRN